MSSATEAVSVELKDVVADAALDALEAENPRFVALVRRALNVRAGEGFADVERLDVIRVRRPRLFVVVTHANIRPARSRDASVHY